MLRSRLLGHTVVAMFLMNAHLATGDQYVSHFYGSDTNGDGSPSFPWQTISKAAQVVGSGETIYVQNDTYNEQVTLTDKHGITLTGWNSGSGKPIIDGTDITVTCCGETTSALLQINDSTNIVIDGFEVRDSEQSGIGIRNNPQLQRTDGITIINCLVSHSQTYGIVSAANGTTIGPINVTIQDNEVYKSCLLRAQVVNSGGEGISMVRTTNFDIVGNEVHGGYKEGIDAKVGCKNGHIRGNFVHSALTIPANLEPYSPPGIYVDANGVYTENIHIHSNFIVGRRGGISLNTEQHGAGIVLKNIDVYNNLVWGLTDKNGAPTCCLNVTRAGNNGVLKDGAFENIYVANNTMLSNGVCINVVNMDTSELENLTIENNIVDVDDEQNTEPPIGSSKRFVRIVKRNNQLFWSETEMSVSSIIVTNNMFRWKTSTGREYQHGINLSDPRWHNTDPDFVYRALKDYRLDGGSPAANRITAPLGGSPVPFPSKITWNPKNYDIVNSFLNRTGVLRASSFNLGAYE